MFDLKKAIKDKFKTFTFPTIKNQDLRNALKAFLKGETFVFGHYVATENALVYRTLSTVDGYHQDVLCIRLVQLGQVHYLGNSSALSFTDSKIAFGKRKRNWGQTEAQSVLSAMGIPMLPFTAFHQAGLKVTETVIIDQTKPETVKRQTGTVRNKPVFGEVHFTGASLIKNKKSVFLFDIDREEIKHGIFNPFLVELSKPAKTVKDAYDSLIPDEVKKAMAMGAEIKRQGEYFFIKMTKAGELLADHESRRDAGDPHLSVDVIYTQGHLSAQGNRPHIASRFNKSWGYVSGFVSHTGREHKDLDLSSGWWKPVPNTAVKAFTLTGDVD